jgi:hypothetical protein
MSVVAVFYVLFRCLLLFTRQKVSLQSLANVTAISVIHSSTITLRHLKRLVEEAEVM